MYTQQRQNLLLHVLALHRCHQGVFKVVKAVLSKWYVVLNPHSSCKECFQNGLLYALYVMFTEHFWQLNNKQQIVGVLLHQTCTHVIFSCGAY